MKIYLKNIGKIKEANIELDGITIIAGDNNTGKSTIGKSVYCLYNTLFRYKRTVNNNRVNRCITKIKEYIQRYCNVDNVDISSYENDMIRQYMVDSSASEVEIVDVIELSININLENDSIDDFRFSNEDRKNIIRIMSEIKNISDDDIVKQMFQLMLRYEFGGDINRKTLNSLESGEISISVGNRKINILINDNRVEAINNIMELGHLGIYIDDPMIVDSLLVHPMYKKRPFHLSKHSELLKQCFTYENDNIGRNAVDFIGKVLLQDRIKEISNRIAEVCEGDLEKNNGEYFFIDKKNQLRYYLSNLSTGMKAFVIIKTLLEKGFIDERGLLILDEPEIHLHPKWQLLCAEIIVMLQKEFDLHILVNSHSPYFINAIEVYAEKYGITEKCKYYLSDEKYGSSSFIDVTNNLEPIYAKMATPLQELENLRYN